METLIAVLLIINLVVVLGVGVLVVLRTRGGQTTSAPESSRELVDTFKSLNADVRSDLAAQRGELNQAIALSHQQIATRVHEGSEAQSKAFARERDARAASHTELRDLLDHSINERLAKTLKTSLDENAQRVQRLTESNVEQQTKLKDSLRVELERLREGNAVKQEELKASLRSELDKLRDGNEKKLEQMRLTVDEKLQGTLEKRLGESFTLVSERLEQVQKGLGEMQTLASDVGGLKRVLTNVKSRGGWGEVQLARQLEDLLTRDQYEENVAVKPGSSERVEFAVKLPGRDVDQPVLLPVDSKLPQEDYERLLDAQDTADVEAIDKAGKALERVLLEQAKTISSKYIDPPHTTDFAIMYLPTEGLFAETIRRPGLVSRMQQDLRVMVMGPTTLGSMLTSLQMGFRTLAIEKRSSEVWQVLGEAKAEFGRYGDTWDRLSKQLTTAQNTVKEAGRRTRAVERKLRDVETLEVGASDEVIDDLLEELTDGPASDQ